MTTVLIIGTGSFGKFFGSLLESSYEVSYISSRSSSDEDFRQAVELAEIIILAIPLSGYESTLARMSLALRPASLIVDVCSVKQKPMEKLHSALGYHNNWLMSHPLFGPQSAAGGTEDHQLVVCEESGSLARELKSFFSDVLRLRVVMMSAEDHDRQMARAQALTFFVSEVLSDLSICEQELMTPSYKKLLDVKDLASYESEELLELFQQENEYSAELRDRFAESVNLVSKKYRK